MTPRGAERGVHIMRKLLSTSTIALALKGTAKEEIIAEMIDLLVAAGKISDREGALNCVLERERKMSTGMQHGIAIPHGKTATLDELVAAVALKKEGVDFGALDGEPSRIFIMVISPQASTGPHIQFLAEISRALSDPDVRKAVLAAENRVQVLAALCGD